jgi:pentapeptide repeat protein
MLRFRGARCCGRLREALASPGRIPPFLLASIASLVAVYPSPAQAARLRPVSARTILSRVDRGLPVRENHVEVQGSLHLRATVSAPLVLQDSTIDGGVTGSSTTFLAVLDLSDTKVVGPLDLSDGDFHGPVLMSHAQFDRGARFDFASVDQSALVEHATFKGDASFKGTVFRGPARFSSSEFKRGAEFGLAEFSDLGIFEITQFDRGASFSSAEFRSSADFVAAAFGGPSSFDDVRFFDGAEYVGGRFASSVTFHSAHFDGDTTFRRRYFLGRATFASATATGVLDFDGATFYGRLDFSTAQLGDVEFSGGEKTGGTELAKPVVFDEAIVDTLNLDGAKIESKLRLPDPRGIGRIRNLRMDPGDVDRIRAVKRKGTRSYGTRSARERALALIETAARDGGDIAAADTAEIHRLTLERRDENPFYAAVDWGVGWQIGGYLVSPLHPILVLVSFLLLAALGRSWKARRDSKRSGLRGRLRGFRDDLRDGLSALWTFDPAGGGFLRFFEQLATKALVVAFVLSVGNVEPGLSPIVKGVLP